MPTGHRMLQPGTGLHRLPRAAILVASLWCALPGPGRADADADGGAPAPRVFHHGTGAHMSAAQSLDEAVRRLSTSLDLDPSQQAQLRQILVDQQREFLRLRRGAAAAQGDATSEMLAINGRTRARIRALLTDAQKSKYPADVQHNDMESAQASLRHWMQVQEAQRQQGNGAPQ